MDHSDRFVNWFNWLIEKTEQFIHDLEIAASHDSSYSKLNMKNKHLLLDIFLVLIFMVREDFE